MTILIDNDPLRETIPACRSFPEFCEKIMGILLARNLCIGTCELDGTVVTDLDEADRLFATCAVCRIASIPLAAALEVAIEAKCSEATLLEQEALDLVTQVLLAEASEIAADWHSICELIKGQVGFLPRLSGILTEAQINQLADLELKELTEVMQKLHTAFNTGDTLAISDSIELQLLPWLRKLREFLENCLTLVKTLQR